MLVVVSGVPGVGKTSVAEHVADRTGGTLLRTDVVRKDLFEDPEYTDEEARRVYGELLDRGARAVDPDGVAVLDGTFHAREYRERALATAERVDAELRFLKVECDPDVARERIREREGDASDATVAVHDAMRDAFDPLEVDHATIDNTGTPAATQRQVDAALGTVPAGAAERAATQGPAP